MWVRDKTSIIITNRGKILFRTSYYYPADDMYLDVYQTEHSSIVDITIG